MGARDTAQIQACEQPKAERQHREIRRAGCAETCHRRLQKRNMPRLVVLASKTSVSVSGGEHLLMGWVEGYLKVESLSVRR